MKGIAFGWRGKGFGNALLLALLTKICNDNDIPAVFSQHKSTIGLVDVPLYENDNKEHEQYHVYNWLGIRNTYWRKNVDEPVLIQYLKHIGSLCGKTLVVDERHNHIPVVFKEIEVPSVDVVMCTQTGPWAPYRDWPYFEELKQKLSDNNITFVDLHEKGIYSIECLNYVKNAKLYLGLETGMSHYVSKYANGKALIIQSGFCPFGYWAWNYDYDYVKAEVVCVFRPCFIDKNILGMNVKCPHDNYCMTSISVNSVFDEIVRKVL